MSFDWTEYLHLVHRHADSEGSSEGIRYSNAQPGTPHHHGGGVLAGELCGVTTFPPSNADAKHRSAISRAYYAAFCMARWHLVNKDRDPKARGRFQVHQYVIGEFQKSSDPVRKRIGTNLDRLKKCRTQADYDNTVGGLPKVSVVATHWSNTVLQDLKKL